MTSAMIGAKLSNLQNPNYLEEDHGAFIIAIDISAFYNLDIFYEEVADFNEIIRKQKGVNNTKVVVSGDNNLDKYKLAVESGSFGKQI